MEVLTTTIASRIARMCERRLLDDGRLRRSGIASRTIGSSWPPTTAGQPVPLVTKKPGLEVQDEAISAASAEMEGKLSGMGLTPAQIEGVLALSREVIERVVWEVVPDLAETIIREEIKRLTS